MKFFLGLEYSGAAGSKWRDIIIVLEPMLLECFKNASYSCLDSIGIISMIFQDEYADVYPERIYFSRKKKYADVRLNISYKAFVRGPDMERKKLYVEHLLTSLNVLYRKMKSAEEIAALDDIVERTKSVCEAYQLQT